MLMSPNSQLMLDSLKAYRKPKERGIRTKGELKILAISLLCQGLIKKISNYCFFILIGIGNIKIGLEGLLKDMPHSTTTILCIKILVA